MKGRKRSGWHKIALAALFTVGNSLIRFPWRSADPGMLTLFFLSSVGALIPAFLLYPLFRKLFRARLSGNRFHLVLSVFLALGIGCYAIWCGWKTASDYVRYTMETILSGEHRMLFCLLFVGCCARLASISGKGRDVFALLCFAGVSAAVVFLFAAGFAQFRPSYLTITVPDRFSVLAAVLPSLWMETLLPLTILAAYIALSSPGKGARALAVGTVTGSGLLLLCVLQTLLTFGGSYAATLPYPYSYAVQIISVGQYFFRLEGFSYLLDFAACLIRTSVCLSCAGKLLGRFCPRLGRWVPYAAGGGILLFLLI